MKRVESKVIFPELALLFQWMGLNLTKFFSLTRDALFSENLAQSHSDRGADAKYVGIDWARGIRDTHVSCAVEGIDEYEACEYFYNNNYTCMMPIVIIVI